MRTLNIVKNYVSDAGEKGTLAKAEVYEYLEPIMSKRIAVLITCFNRKQKTLDCLQALFNQVNVADVSLQVYLVDDGSTDGTGEAVQQKYPQVKVLQGDGNLFWNGGMRLAFDEASKDEPDFYLWLNDDTLLAPDALRTLLDTYYQLAETGLRKAIVAGSTRDPVTGVYTYGGKVQSRWWHPLNLDSVEPTEKPQRCDTMCGNCVLIPREVAQVVGNLDPAFVHYAGDWDYGLRAKQKGCTVWIAPGYQGTCPANPKPQKQTNVTLGERINKVQQPKGLALEDVTLQPMKEWKVLTQRHAGFFWPIYWLLPYRRLLWLYIAGLFKKGA